MRTTLDIDDDVLKAAKELAEREGRTAGAVLSDLARSVVVQRKEKASGAAGWSSCAALSR